MALKDFASSFLLIISWLLFSLCAYALYWTIVIPGLAIVPFLVFLISSLICFYCSRKLNARRKAN